MAGPVLVAVLTFVGLSAIGYTLATAYLNPDEAGLPTIESVVASVQSVPETPVGTSLSPRKKLPQPAKRAAQRLPSPKVNPPPSPLTCRIARRRPIDALAEHARARRWCKRQRACAAFSQPTSVFRQIRRLGCSDPAFGSTRLALIWRADSPRRASRPNSCRWTTPDAPTPCSSSARAAKTPRCLVLRPWALGRQQPLAPAAGFAGNAAAGRWRR